MQDTYQEYPVLPGIFFYLVICLIPLNIGAGNAREVSKEFPPTWQQLGLMEGFPPRDGKLVTKSNFTKPPYNRWAFQHLRYLNYSAPIERGIMEITQFGVKLQDLMNKEFYINNRSQTLLNFAKQSYTDSLIILYKGNIVTEYYDNGMTEQTPHCLASMTKSFVGTLAELMIYRGLLNPNKKVSDYIPELQKSGYGDATVRQVLDMEVGVPGEGDFTEVRKPGTYLNDFTKAMGWYPSCENISMYDVLPQAPHIGPDGKKFTYTSATAEVAGWLLSKITEQPLEVLLSKEIWSKLGSSGEAYTLVDSQSKMISTGGLNLTTRDTARFSQMIANGGNFNNQQILSKEVIKSFTNGGNKQTWKEGEFSEMSPDINSYRSYWYQTDNESHAIMALGSYGQDIYIDPVNNVVIVKFGTYPAPYHDEFDDGWMTVCPQIVKALITHSSDETSP